MNLKQLLIQLSKPAGVISLKYLLNNPPYYIQHHKAILLKLPLNASKAKGYFIILMKQIGWYLFFGWKDLIRVLKVKSNPIYQRANLSPLKEFSDLILLTFGYSVPPINYYIFKLYHYPRRQWLMFYFSHEVPKWHYVLSENISEKSKKFLSSKSYFAKQLEKNQIPAIPTIKFVKQNTVLTDKDLFQNRSIFLKPDDFHGGVGCLKLIYQNKTQKYNLVTDDRTYDSHNAILKIVNLYIKKFNYLFQPILENGENGIWKNKIDDLATIRVISSINSGKIEIIDAILQIPRKNYFDQIRIDIETGKLGTPIEVNNTLYTIGEDSTNIYKNKEITPSKWKETIKMIKNAHQLCKDVCTVGWDIGLSQNQWVIIEGNIGYGITIHQLNLNKVESPIWKIIKKKYSNVE